MVAILSMVLVVQGLVAVRPADQAAAVSNMVPQTLVGFDAGNLIDDTVFFAKDTMSAAQIQSFLSAKVPRCQSGYTCLKDFGMATTSRSADAMCTAPYAGSGWESAAQIIFKVAQACGINPQVLLVTLQKEQSLVTHTWPSPERYTIAMGQGCPDTAGCDARYFGFFNQVYGAAWQLKRYANPPGTSQYFTWYAPGRTWNIRFHPDASCGSSPVYIANQATANLFYYTPYQPNAAAMAAGHGEGDRCSAYGNRNFYNYFTDWFGSTRGASVTLAKSDSSSTVWIVSRGSRWALTDVTEWNELNRVFGPTHTVGDSYIQALVNRGIGSNIVRDAATGAMAVIDEGKAWGLASCADVATWGGTCDNPVDLESTTYRKAPVGPVVGAYLRTHGSSHWGRVESGTVRVLYDGASAQRLNGGVLPSAPRMSPRAYAVLPRTSTVFAPGELVYTTFGGTVSMTDAYQRLIGLTSWNTAREMGIAPGSARLVPESALAPYTARGTTLGALVSCGGATYFPASGTLHPLSDPAATGLTTTALEPATCATLKLSTTALPVVLVKATGDPSVYAILGGVKRPLTAWSEAIALGGANPVVLTVDAAWITAMAAAVPVIADGTLVKGSGASVFLLSGGVRYGVTSFAVTREIGFGDSFRQISDTELSSLGNAGPALGLWVSCNGATFFAAGAALHAVQVPDPTFPVTPLTAAACNQLNSSGTAVPKVFIQAADATVYVARDGAYSPVGSWGRLLSEAGGSAPTILRVSAQTLSTLSRGPLLL